MTSRLSPRGRETVTAFFETRGEAEAALERLRRDGISTGEARIYEGRSEAASIEADRDTHHKGFWETLGDLFLPGDDRGTYAEGLTRGGTLLSVPVRSEERSRVLDLLDEAGTIDMDEREESWRGEGWGGPATSPVFGDASLTGVPAGDTGLTEPSADPTLRSGIAGIGGHSAGAPAAPRFARRDESFGRRRARSYRWDEAEEREEQAIEIEETSGSAGMARTGHGGVSGRLA